jgi:hypothetical protein
MRLKPKLNDERRVVFRFLLFPLQIKNDRRWLEFVYIEQSSWLGASGTLWWTNVRFL